MTFDKQRMLSTFLELTEERINKSYKKDLIRTCFSASCDVRALGSGAGGGPGREGLPGDWEGAVLTTKRRCKLSRMHL